MVVEGECWRCAAALNFLWRSPTPWRTLNSAFVIRRPRSLVLPESRLMTALLGVRGTTSDCTCCFAKRLLVSISLDLLPRRFWLCTSRSSRMARKAWALLGSSGLIQGTTCIKSIIRTMARSSTLSALDMTPWKPYLLPLDLCRMVPSRRGIWNQFILPLLQYLPYPTISIGMQQNWKLHKCIVRQNSPFCLAICSKSLFLFFLSFFSFKRDM
jgi:hypothetical protein